MMIKLHYTQKQVFQNLFSSDYIAHHISYDKETNTMEMQLVHKESHKAVPHKGGVKDYEDQTGQKYKRNSYAK